MTIPIHTFVAAVGVFVLLGIALTYHLGWKHGWGNGYRVGNDPDSTRDDREDQPAPKTLFGLPYALGWHHGWDYGFREGYRTKTKQSVNEDQTGC